MQETRYLIQRDDGTFYGYYYDQDWTEQMFSAKSFMSEKSARDYVNIMLQPQFPQNKFTVRKVTLTLE